MTTATHPDNYPYQAAAVWFQQLERAMSQALGYGAVLADWATTGTLEWLREAMTPAEAAAWLLAGEDEDDFPVTCPICDGTHGELCPVESPDPGYYADELAAGR